MGVDPIGFYTFHSGKTDFLPAAWLKTLKPAFTVYYPDSAVPSLLKRSPALCKQEIPAGQFQWEIDFTWFGLPVAFRPVKMKSSSLKIENVSADFRSVAEKRSVLACREGQFFPGKTLKNYLEIIFNPFLGK